MKTFLAAGDVLINPSLISYATVETDSEGVHLRLGFAGQAGAPHGEVRLAGSEARSVLRWLRTNADFLDPGPSAIRLDKAQGPGSPRHAAEVQSGCSNRPAALIGSAR